MAPLYFPLYSLFIVSCPVVGVKLRNGRTKEALLFCQALLLNRVKSEESEDKSKEIISSSKVISK
jgi:hypothetical protein